MRMLRPFRRSPSETREREARPVADRCSLFEGHAGRLLCQWGALRHGDELRVCAEAVDAKDVLADLELGDGCADYLDLSSQLHAADLPLRSAEAGEEAGDERLGCAEPAVRPVTVVAWILTRTSSSLGTGRSTSSSRRTSGGPYVSWTTALMRSGNSARSCIDTVAVAAARPWAP